MKKKKERIMYISVMPGEQIEVAVAEDGDIAEYYIELMHQRKVKGNIYKGVVNNLDTNLQAAFINYGAEKNGFLQIDEVHPEYYKTPFVPSKNRKYPLIQKVLKPGDEILVQVVKEPTQKKGAFLTSYPMLVGRFLILTPGQEQAAISRKIEEESQRNTLRSLLSTINPGNNLGVIIRTNCLSVTKSALQRDLQFLKRLWKVIYADTQKKVAPSLIYEEPSLWQRAIRDYVTEDTTKIIVDDEGIYNDVREYISLVSPRRSKIVEHYKEKDRTLFDYAGLAAQIKEVFSREVVLPSGGRLVFDQTEALMAIDINSGKVSGKTNFEAMALKINIEAAEHIAKQIRLKDIGGQIVIDFIEMKDPQHWHQVERAMKHAMKTDKARYEMTKISRFGLLEIVRQRTGVSAFSSLSEICPHCSGTGVRANMEWQATSALRTLYSKLQDDVSELPYTYYVDEELALYLLNNKRMQLTALEEEFNRRITVSFLRSMRM